MKCDQIRFIFQHCPLCSPHAFSIIVVVLGYHWLKKSAIADMLLSYELCSHLFIYIFIYLIKLNFGKFILKTTVLEQQNTPPQILEALHIRNKHPKLNRINFESNANVLKCL